MVGICFQPVWVVWKRWVETSQTGLELKLVMSHLGLYHFCCDSKSPQQGSTTFHSKGVQRYTAEKLSSPQRGNIDLHREGAQLSTSREHCIPHQRSTAFHSKGAQLSTVKETSFRALWPLCFSSDSALPLSRCTIT